MNDEDSIETTSPQVDKGGVPPEDRSVAKLEDGPKQCGCEWSVRVTQSKLVKVMNVSDAKVQRCEEDELLGRLC